MISRPILLDNDRSDIHVFVVFLWIEIVLCDHSDYLSLILLTGRI